MTGQEYFFLKVSFQVLLQLDPWFRLQIIRKLQKKYSFQEKYLLYGPQKSLKSGPEENQTTNLQK